MWDFKQKLILPLKTKPFENRPEEDIKKHQFQFLRFLETNCDFFYSDWMDVILFNII